MTDQLHPDHDPETETTVHPTPADVPAGEATTPMAPPVVPPAPAPTAGPAEDVGGAAVTPVAAAATDRPRTTRTRWIAAIAIVAVLAIATGAAAMLLTGASPTATVTGYVPSDSVMYGEVRLDLPGDQARQVGEFLSHFPGFADQAALDTKLDEVLDQLISDMPEGEQTFTKDIKPWFDGELAFAVGPLPSGLATQDPEAAMADGRALVLLSIKDEALARAWFADVLSQSGATPTTETYEGVELTVFKDPDVAAVAAAIAIVDGKVAVMGDLASVKSAIDTKGDGGLDDTEAYKAASTAMDGDHIGFFFVDMRALVTAATALTEDLASAPPVSSALLALVPDWAAGRLRVEGDALVVDTATPHVEGAPGPDANRPNGVPEWAPTGTILLAAGNDYGATVQETIALYRQDPNLGEIFTSIDQAAGVLGGTDAIFGWMGDAGIVVARDGSDVEGGLVVLPTDAAAGKQLLTTIRSFAQLGGGGGIEVREEDYAGTTITIIDLGSASDLIGMAGALGGGAIPTDPGATPGLPEGNVELAYAATDSVVVVGSGPDFVKSVLDAGAGTSLADDARFDGLVERVGTDHTGLTFLDVTAVREVVESQMASLPATDVAEYEESIKPFLTPFDAVVAATTLGGDLDSTHAVITVK